jgi:hypothetical protein
MVAVGEAKLAEFQGRTADANTAWDVVAQYGINGEEGAAMDEAQSIADSYVATHPEQVAYLEPYRDPDFQTTIIRDGVAVTVSGHEAIVTMISLARQSGLEEAALIITMFELASFERQKIGVAVQIQARSINSGSGG